MPTCSAPGCRSGYAAQEKPCVQRHFFKPPNDSEARKAWSAAIPRKDFKVTAKTYICDIHFEPEDLITCYEHIINGSTVQIPRGRWKIKAGAVPRIFPSIPPHLSKPKTLKPGRRPPKQRATANRDVCPTESDNVCCGNNENIVPDETGNSSDSGLCSKEATCFPAFQGLSKFESWNVELMTDKVIFFKIVESGGVVLMDRVVAVREDFTVAVSSRGRLVPPCVYSECGLEKQLQLSSLKWVSSFLSYVENLRVCTGCNSSWFPSISAATTALKAQNVWRSVKCCGLSLQSLCPPCKSTRKNLRAREKRNKEKKAKELTGNDRLFRSRTKNLRKKVIRATIFREKARNEICAMKMQLSKVSNSEIDKVVEGLPQAQQLALHAALKACKAKSARGKRYQSEWLMTCPLLKISSPSAYRLMSKMNLLPLPTSSRLKQIIKGMPCEFGFNKVSLASIGAFKQQEEGVRRYGTLILDDMKVRRTVTFNKQTYKVDGFVDYGDDKESTAVADHALVLMFVPLFHSWVQPIASFATKNAAPGRVLARMVLEAVIQLHKQKATVVAVISDGASTNKAMWSTFGITGNFHAPNHKTEHPCIPDKSLYFLCDVPHIIKCIRNHLLRHKYGMIGEHRVNFDHYRVLQEVESKQQLRVVPKLTKEHVNPDNLREMNVRLAVQLFSRSTAIGLKLYKRLEQPGLENCEGTVQFTILVNSLFDALNVKLPRYGIRSSSKETEVIKEFLMLVNATEQNHIRKGTAMFASQVTMESLRVTLSSVLDLITGLLSEGAQYVLTGKLNQDPLERFFGVTRSFGGDEDHPTIVSFSHIYRLLSLYTPIKNCITSNVVAEPTLVLAAVQETMKAGKKERLATHEQLQDTIRLKLSKLCRPPIGVLAGRYSAPDHGYSMPAAQDCVVYYLCGYLVHTFLKHEKCAGCISEIQSSCTQCPEAFLTLEREFKEGCLKHPSWSLFNLFRTVESKISTLLQENSLCVDTFWDILDSLKSCGVQGVGCSIHKNTLTAELLQTYIVLRMHFAAKDACKQLTACGTIASVRKKVKM